MHISKKNNNKLSTKQTGQNYFLHAVRISGNFGQFQRVEIVGCGWTSLVSVAHELKLTVPHIKFELGAAVFIDFGLFLLGRG